MKVSNVLNKSVEYDYEVNKLAINSRDVSDNDIFFALKGSKTDGNLYIEEAIKKGAKAVVTEDNSIVLDKINVIVVEDIKKYLALCCKRYYGDLSKKIKIVGITGTNGKTTTATLIYKYYRFIGKNAALLSTNGNYINDVYYQTNNTTPNIIEIYDYLNLAIKADCEIFIMEVSSHAVCLNRIFGLNFYIGALTNLTLDHLDFHKNIYDYHYSKVFFLSKCLYPIMNVEYEKYIPFFNENIKTFGKNVGNYHFVNCKKDGFETRFEFIKEDEKHHFKTSLLGEYNIYNVTLFLTIMDTLKMYDYNKLKIFLESKILIPGRLEIINENPFIIVDFAHTPDAVEKILNLVNEYKKKKGKVITVIGMGGNRDKSKRKEVGKISSELSDIVIYTEDNSRNENVIDIINDILEGVIKENYVIEYNRIDGIKKALELARENDIICILGRGCEEFLEVNNMFIPFNDKTEVLKLIYKYYN